MTRQSMDHNPYTPPAARVVDTTDDAAFLAKAGSIQPGHRRVVRMLTSLLIASAVAAAVFALAWIRPPFSTSTLTSTLSLLVGFGIVFAILSLLIGLPLAFFIEWCRIGTAGSYTGVAAVVGALLAFAFGRRHTGEVPNPHGGAVFSPWTRDRPGIDEFPVSFNEYLDSIVFLALVGGVLGFAFWYFYSQGPRTHNR